MSITTYAELQSSVERWTKRTDLATYFPDYVQLAEQRIYNGAEGMMASDPLRIISMQARETGTISGAIAFPTRYLETINLRVTSNGETWPLRYVAPQNYAERVTNTDAPSFYTVLNNAIQTVGTGGADYTHDYYAKFAALTSSNTTNTLLTNYPDLYLYGVCLEVALDLVDDAMAQRFYARFMGALNSANTSNRNLYAGGSLAVMVGR